MTGAAPRIPTRTVSDYLSRGPAKMARWRDVLFIFMSRNAQPATQFFGLPPNRVVELGAQIEF